MDLLKHAYIRSISDRFVPQTSFRAPEISVHGSCRTNKNSYLDFCDAKLGGRGSCSDVGDNLFLVAAAAFGSIVNLAQLNTAKVNDGVKF